MATQDRTNSDAALKDYYENLMVDFLNRKVVLRNKVKRTTRGFSGRLLRFDVYLRAGYSVGSRDELEELPTNIAETDVNATVRAKYHYVTVEISGPVESATKDDKGSWYRMKPELLKRKTKNYADAMNRQYCSMSGRGILCEASSVTGADPYTVVIKTYGASVTFDNADGWAPETHRFIKPGMLVSWGRANTAAATFFTSTGGLAAGYGSVTSKSGTTTFVLDLLGGVAPVADDVFVLGHGLAKAAHSYNKESMGIRGIVDDADDDFQAVDTGTYTEWAAKVFESDSGAGNARPIDEDLMTQAYDYVYDESSVEELDVILCSRPTRRAYVNSLRGKAAERYMATEFTGGVKSLTFDGGNGPTPILTDKMLANREMTFLSMADLELAQQRGFGFDSDGGGIWRKVEGQDAEKAYAKEYSNLMSRNRRGHAVIRDIEVTGIAY